MTETTNHCQKSFKTSVEMQPFLDDSVYWLHGHGYSWNILRWPGWLVQQRPRHAKLDPYIEDSPGLKTWRKLASVDSCQRLHSLHLGISYIYIYTYAFPPWFSPWKMINDDHTCVFSHADHFPNRAFPMGFPPARPLHPLSDTPSEDDPPPRVLLTMVIPNLWP
jgi:hypothetical protein